MHVRNKKSGISSLYLLLCGFFFLLCLFFSKPSANKKSGISLSYNCFFAAILFCFPFSFAMRLSFTVVIRQCSANCMQLPSPQLHLTCLYCYSTTSMLEKQSIQHYPERTTTMMEQQKSNRADGTWGRSTEKNEKYSDPRPFHTWFGN